MVKYSIQDLYLDWVNNFLTIERFAEYHGITKKQAGHLLELGRDIHEDIVKLEKELRK